MAKMIQVKLIKSTIGVRKSHKEAVRCLGLRKINQTREFEDCPTLRGQIKKVDYLIEWNEK